MSVNVAELRDALMDARLDVEEYFAEALAEFEGPDALLGLALHAATLPPEMFDQLDPATKAAILEVFNA
jgi:hypothetical protein